MDQPSGESTLYSGEKLVSDDSYLRKLPVALPLKERMRFDAIVTSADIINQAYNALRQLSMDAGIDLDKFTNSARAYALSQCWTLVDQIHAARQLLLPPRGMDGGTLTQAFLDASSPATKLRNDMDHLADKLDNLSKRKGLRLPVFGCLSYYYSAEPGADEGYTVTIMSGALHGDDLMPSVNPFNKHFTPPTGLFTFWAFDNELEFGRAIGALRDWIRGVESNLESDIRMQLAKQGGSEEEIEAAMATLGAGLAFVVHFELIDDDDGGQGEDSN